VRSGALGVGALLAATAAAAPLAPIPQDLGANGLALALRRLPATTRVLYVTAHPDDEHNGVLVALARGLGVTTALLTLTRGEGGQNAIGPELFEELGVLRTAELEAVHRFDGVEQYFGAAYEFGFSVNLEETLARWGEEETLGDVVRVVRQFRPDLVLTMPLEGKGHQHHTAAARLAAEAFRAAADPRRFPEQLRDGLRPWQPRKLYQGGVGGGEGPEGTVATSLPLARHDPLLGMTWAEFGSLARAMHRCQAQSQLKVEPDRFREARYVLVDAAPPLAEGEAELLAGVPRGLADLAGWARGDAAAQEGLADLQRRLQAAQDAFDGRAPERSAGPLASALGVARRVVETVRDGALPADARYELLHRLEEGVRNVEAALALAVGLGFEPVAEDGDVVPGQTLTVSAKAWSARPIVVDDLSLSAPDGWSVRRVAGEPAALGPGQVLAARFEVTVARDAAPSGPYWRRRPGADRYDVAVPSDRGRPWSPPPLRATLRYRVDGIPASLERPVVQRYAGRFVGGERRKAVAVVPALSLRVEPELAVFPSRARGSRELRVTLASQAAEPLEAVVRLEAPPGFGVEPREATLGLPREGAEAQARFAVTAPRDAKPGQHVLAAVASAAGREYRDALRVVAYDHVEERRLTRPAQARAVSLDVRLGRRIAVGYVAGAGDEVVAALRQLGLSVTLLTPDHLAGGALDHFTTIVLGVRAYGARPELRATHARLMDFVTAGGHLVVQYQREEFNPPGDGPSPFAPYPARVSENRVTDETAPVEVLAAGHPLLSTPNRIGEDDWRGWVQERGVQFLATADSRYGDLVVSADPFPANPGRKTGMLVEARVGKGTWTYVGLALFRQLPAGTPGAYRLLANLVSRPRGR
jgi:LmbE family N-acetylglucosaminyl deacetylase